jgi:hypothetical protein
VLPRPYDSKAIAKTQSKGLCRCLYAIIFGHRWTKIASWERFHGGWPMVIIQHLRKQLPPGYVAESLSRSARHSFRNEH